MPNYNFQSLTKYYWTANYKITLSNSMSFKEKKKQEERNSNERRKPNVPSSGFKPFQDGIPGIVLTFQSRRQSLGTSKWARPNLVMDSHFYLSPGWGNRFPINHPRRGCRNVPTGSDPLRSFLNLRKTWAAQALDFT